MLEHIDEHAARMMLLSRTRRTSKCEQRWGSASGEARDSRVEDLHGRSKRRGQQRGQGSSRVVATTGGQGKGILKGNKFALLAA